jgi:hypothetical protein
MNAYDLLLSYQRARIAQAKNASGGVQRQIDLIPQVSGQSPRSSNGNGSKLRKLGSRSWRDQFKIQTVSERISLRQQIIKRAHYFARVPLNAGYALCQKSAIDRPAPSHGGPIDELAGSPIFFPTASTSARPPIP